MSASAAACSLSLISTRVPANAALATLKAKRVATAISFFMCDPHCLTLSPSSDLGAGLRQCQSTIHMPVAEHSRFMAEAIAEARRAAAECEVPVGAIAVADGLIVGAGHNRPIGLADPTAHAEILAVRAAASTLKTYRLTGVSVYVTLEPCVMCVGAMLNARVARIVFGARDDKAGALGSVYDIGRDGMLNHRFEVVGGVMEAECAELLREFFRARRGGA